jgi:histidine triad (HIT) family protein
MEYETKTIFERIINGEIPSEKIFENECVVAFKDIQPKAPIHILIVPRKVIPCIQAMEPDDFFLLGEVVKAAQQISMKLKLNQGYRLVVNNGLFAGQTIDHLHFHLLGGGPLGEMA